MGKYNFNYSKLQQLEQENQKLRANNEQLAKAMETLAKEVVELKQSLGGMPSRKMRSPYSKIENAADLDELFGVRVAETGDISGTAIRVIRDNRATKNNFNTFYANIVRAVLPIARPGTECKPRTTLGYMPFNDMSDNQYDTTVQLIADCVKLCIEAKHRMEENE